MCLKWPICRGSVKAARYSYPDSFHFITSYALVFAEFRMVRTLPFTTASLVVLHLLQYQSIGHRRGTA